MFHQVPDNVVICINENINHETIFEEIQYISCYVLYCMDDWKSKQKKIIYDNDECIESCDNSEQYQYEYNGFCYDYCEQGPLLDDNKIEMNKCKCELKECLTCPFFSRSHELCTICNTGYYQKENDPLNLGEYIKCYK